MGGAYEHTPDGLMFWDGDGIAPCDECGKCADYLCDFPMGRGKTCDHKLCDEHAHPLGSDRHLCPIHAAIYQGSGAMEPIKMDRYPTIAQDSGDAR
jgi:hypothetical protein